MSVLPTSGFTQKQAAQAPKNLPMEASEHNHLLRHSLLPTRDAHAMILGAVRVQLLGKVTSCCLVHCSRLGA